MLGANTPQLPIQRPEMTFIFLCALFSLLLCLGNLIYQKFIYLAVGGIAYFELSAGAIVYPFTFLVTDLCAEFFGKERSRFMVRLGMMLSAVVAFIIIGIDALPATAWSKVGNDLFHHVFGHYPTALIGGLIAGYISQMLDIRIYLAVRKVTKNRFLWARNLSSTSISLFVDTTVVISILTFFGVLPKEQYLTLITGSFSFKLFFAFCSVPLFYLGTFAIRRFINVRTK